MSQENVEVVKAFTTLFQAGDRNEWRDYFDPDVVRDIASKAMSRHLYQARQMWNLITFTIWHSTFVENRARSPIEL